MISYESEADSRAELAASGQSKDCPEKDAQAVWSEATK
jgi:hypothetical protein